MSFVVPENGEEGPLTRPINRLPELFYSFGSGSVRGQPALFVVQEGAPSDVRGLPSDDLREALPRWSWEAPPMALEDAHPMRSPMVSPPEFVRLHRPAKTFLSSAKRRLHGSYTERRRWSPRMDGNT
ncbi:hypothetical protein K443DRAFT_594072 [Laccaria amethystina LaAM-08-1]|uniref:Uncharacterized protein n=1 Tax=Laccaria amethystina LaAM-08-1 TaxID=1095629 RepID=A0A0C9WR29_9AGAR|nr:hypothetical protein K443DRAFT_594072 [Laccaria amethystina LaAM-08-1]